MDDPALHEHRVVMMDGGSPRKRRMDEEHQIHAELVPEDYSQEHSVHMMEESKIVDPHLDIETVEPDELIEQGDHEGAEQNGTIEYPIDRKISRGRKRVSIPEGEEGSRLRYYDRYKNQDYVKRNDLSKYCQVCKKKVFGKLRSLPSEHRLRRMWILRLNLDVERSAELWSRDAFSDATHCGEVCSIHFPVGTENYKNRELLPIDMRHDADSYCPQEDETFDFESLELECVFCDAKSPLRAMIPFVRTRSRRYKWINALAGQTDARGVLADRLKNGASKFVCDWHFSDDDFDINQYGEWRLRKDALPNPNLTVADKKMRRIYMVNHGDTILARGVDGRRREDILFNRKDYRYISQKARRANYSYNPYGTDYSYEGDEAEADEGMFENTAEYLVEPNVERPPEPEMGVGASTAYSAEYSDDSDEENEAFSKITQMGESCNARFCQVCDRVVSSDKSMKDYRPRTWPFDEAKHEKWLEIMNWPQNFEESMRVLWNKRRADFATNGNYHFCPINVCQAHLEFRHLHAKMNQWLSTYCVCCDVDLHDENLLLPFPVDRSDRLLWVHTLLSIPTVNKVQEKRWKWLRERLTRTKATRFRICVYHFTQDSFVEKEECIEFNEAALPIPLGTSEYSVVPRGLQGLLKCPLCDNWTTEDDMTDIRMPSTQAERLILVEMFIGDTKTLKKGVENMCKDESKICKCHIPQEAPDLYSIIAERKLAATMEVQCIQCNNRGSASNMIPFPMDPETRIQWITALCRDHFMRSRFLKRLETGGRHYLCSEHFHKSALRYIHGIGIWKKFGYPPLGVTHIDRDRILQQPELPYNGIVISGVDDGDRVQQHLNYDEILAMLGETPAEPAYADEYSQRMTTEQHPCYVAASRIVKGPLGGGGDEEKPPRLEEQGSRGEEEEQHQHHYEEVEEDEDLAEAPPILQADGAIEGNPAKIEDSMPPHHHLEEVVDEHIIVEEVEEEVCE